MLTYFAVNTLDKSEIGYFQSHIDLRSGAMFSDSRVNGLYAIIGYTTDCIAFGKRLNPVGFQDEECLNSGFDDEYEWRLYKPEYINKADELIDMYKAAAMTSLVSCCLV